ncbi:MAG: nucleotidyltransferase domain-containing protein [bacterium]|nr:nucleotidyltransferase domain-containing protein [bacterium]
MKEDITPLIETLETRLPVAFAYLFGSRARGYANERSDWDIAVYFSEPLEKLGRWPAFELEAELSRAIGSTVQVIVLNILPPPILGFQILRGGIVLLDRNENLRMDIENRILRQYYDWQYFLNRQMKAEKQLSS